MIKVVLWDIDGTLLDFLKAEHQAIKNCFAIFDLGICTDEMVSKYSLINKKYWEMFERGEITKDQVLRGRFTEFFTSENISTTVIDDFNKEYQLQLGECIFFNDDSFNIVRNLKGKVKQYAVTNGTKIAQEKKLYRSGFDKLFDGVFISENVGAQKPSASFFDYVFRKIGKYEKDEVMIVGDSLTSDILGGNNAGIKCCWYNPEHKEKHINVKIDVEIDDLNKILTII